MLLQKKAGAADKLNIASSHILWRSLVDRNITIEHFNVLKNFVHDKEFKDFLENTVKDYKNEAGKLFNLLNKYSITSPEPSPRNQNIKVSSEILNDQDIAEVLLRFMRLDVNILMLGLKEIPTNLEVYNYVAYLAKTAINRVDAYITYLKKKKWIYSPPNYRHAYPEAEEVAGSTIYLLWDHLIFRYDNIRLTQIFSVYVSDPILKAMLTSGIKILQTEAKSLEDELLYYGVALPKPYASVTVEPQDKDMYDDRFIFNQILRGMQDAVVLHGTSIAEVIVSDKLRKFFIKLTFRELSYIDKMIEYGSSQGWTFITPEF
ncbi:MAG: DUF3231 family protein [Firmicutes bacterium]|nr:DUF3231 family protein [Bacillota bacterium]